MQVDSSLDQMLDEFLVYKRSLGYLYKSGEYYLRRYAEFENTFFKGEILSEQAVRAFIDKCAETESSVSAAVDYLREFAKYLNKRSIPAYMITEKAGRDTPREPYMFTSEEIACFFKAADSIQPNPEFIGRERVILGREQGRASGAPSRLVGVYFGQVLELYIRNAAPFRARRFFDVRLGKLAESCKLWHKNKPPV